MIKRRDEARFAQFSEPCCVVEHIGRPGTVAECVGRGGLNTVRQITGIACRSVTDPDGLTLEFTADPEKCRRNQRVAAL